MSSGVLEQTQAVGFSQEREVGDPEEQLASIAVILVTLGCSLADAGGCVDVCE